VFRETFSSNLLVETPLKLLYKWKLNQSYIISNYKGEKENNTNLSAKMLSQASPGLLPAKNSAHGWTSPSVAWQEQWTLVACANSIRIRIALPIPSMGTISRTCSHPEKLAAWETCKQQQPFSFWKLQTMFISGFRTHSSFHDKNKQQYCYSQQLQAHCMGHCYVPHQQGGCSVHICASDC
jgi:hypothetical protein